MASMVYPSIYEVAPLHSVPSCTVAVPGSKSITNRALVLAALGCKQTGTRLTGALQSEDTEVMIACLQQLGLRIEQDWDACTITVFPGDDPQRKIPARAADLFVGNSGTTVRFLCAAVALATGRYRFDGVPRMRERPIEDLLSALRQLGVSAISETGNGCPPVVIQSTGLRGGTVEVRADASSQFLSGLMMAAPFAAGDLTLRIAGNLVSEPYIEMTVQMLADWGVTVLHPEPTVYQVPRTPHATRDVYAIEPDASAASYFFAAAAVSGGRITVKGMLPRMLQGDVRFAEVLVQMGCTLQETPEGMTLTGGPLVGIDVDMNAISDTVMSLAAVACFASGPTTIRNVAHIRHKETDRIHALAVELRKLGVTVEEYPDGLKITPCPMHGATVETYHDHRMAMSLAIVGLKVPGVIIENPACVAKTYPGFWTDFERLNPT